MWTLAETKDWKSLEDRFEWVRRMKEVPQDPRHHAEGDVAIHTRMVLEALEKDPVFLRLDSQEREVLWASALLHDVEKYSTTATEADGSITAHGHARKGAQKTRQVLYRESPAPFALREQVAALVRYHGLPLWLLEKPDPLKTLVRASFEVNTEWLALLARADALGRICGDRDDLLYRIACFEEFCKEHGCWGTERHFVTPGAMMTYLAKENASPDYVPFQEPVYEVVLMSGLPGSGKDTYIRKHFADRPVISLDAIRQERGIAPTDKSGNGQVIQEAKELARSFLRKGLGFVWNGTNITLQMRSQLTELFTSYRASVHIIYIEAPFETLRKQNRNRDAAVPEMALNKLAAKMEVPALWEAHRVTYHVVV